MRTYSRSLFFLPIFLMDALILLFLKPVHFPNLVVMNTIAILTLLLLLRVRALKGC